MSDLTDRERDFWLKGGDHYGAHADETAIYVVPQEDGILDHAAAAAIIEREGVWDSVEMGQVYEQDLGGGVTVLTYPATGHRGEAVYRALCTTVYRDGKLVHHQQTPLGAPNRPAPTPGG